MALSLEETSTTQEANCWRSQGASVNLLNLLPWDFSSGHDGQPRDWSVPMAPPGGSHGNALKGDSRVPCLSRKTGPPRGQRLAKLDPDMNGSRVEW